MVMITHVQAEAEMNVMKLAATLLPQGKVIPLSVSLIPDFPFASYEDLMEANTSGAAMVYRFSYQYNVQVFGLLAGPIEKACNYGGMLVQVLGPIAAAICAFFFSWWLLCAIPVCFVLGFKLARNSYNATVLNAALSSDILFSFLYYTGQIAVYDNTTEVDYYWREGS